MKKNVEFEISRLSEKIVDQKKQIDECQAKAEKLVAHAKQTEKALMQSIHQLEQIGQKTQRRDGKPESATEVQKRNNFNDELYREKLRLLKQLFDRKDPVLWVNIQKYLPDVYRDLPL